jgi:hypothetical protein
MLVCSLLVQFILQELGAVFGQWSVHDCLGYG